MPGPVMNKVLLGRGRAHLLTGSGGCPQATTAELKGRRRDAVACKPSRFPVWPFAEESAEPAPSWPWKRPCDSGTLRMRPRNGLGFRARPRERHAGRSVAHGEARAKHSGSGNTRLISSSRDALATARACLGETRKGGGALGAKSARLRGEVGRRKPLLRCASTDGRSLLSSRRRRLPTAGSGPAGLPSASCPGSLRPPPAVIAPAPRKARGAGEAPSAPWRVSALGLPPLTNSDTRMSLLPHAPAPSRGARRWRHCSGPGPHAPSPPRTKSSRYTKPYVLCK